MAKYRIRLNGLVVGQEVKVIEAVRIPHDGERMPAEDRVWLDGRQHWFNKTADDKSYIINWCGRTLLAGPGDYIAELTGGGLCPWNKTYFEAAYDLIHKLAVPRIKGDRIGKNCPECQSQLRTDGSTIWCSSTGIGLCPYSRSQGQPVTGEGWDTLPISTHGEPITKPSEGKMPKYKSREIEVEAMRVPDDCYGLDDDPLKAIAEACRDVIRFCGGRLQDDGYIGVPTLSGVVPAAEGDWIVRDEMNRLSVFTDENFRQRFIVPEAS